MRKARFFFALSFRPEEALISVWIRISFGHFSPFFSKWCGKARRNSDPHSQQNGATSGVDSVPVESDFVEVVGSRPTVAGIFQEIGTVILGYAEVYSTDMYAEIRRVHI
jgi:hypothetical protein